MSYRDIRLQTHTQIIGFGILLLANSLTPPLRMNTANLIRRDRYIGTYSLLYSLQSLGHGRLILHYGIVAARYIRLHIAQAGLNLVTELRVVFSERLLTACGRIFHSETVYGLHLLMRALLADMIMTHVLAHACMPQQCIR